MRILKRSCTLMIVILLFGITGYMNAQTTRTGTVTTLMEKEPLPGVSVVIKGSTTGTVTDIDGKFQISAKKGDVLVFSYIGYLPEEITLGDQSTVDIALSPDIKTLEQVVVMGYSTRKRNEITSAVTTVSSEKLQGVTSNNIETMLQGKVAGISVVDNSGSPGSRPDVRIRGVASLSAPQGPLYVVDGIIGGNFDPNDVETITVLKDAGATGMYGSQANGGVIVVTTKKAKTDAPQIEFKAVYGTRNADHGHVKMMDSKTLYEYQRELYRDPEYFQIDDRKFRAALPDSVLKTNTNWLKECFKPASIQNYYLSASGKSNKLSYYVGGSYYDEEGTFVNTYFKRINLRANTTYNLSNRVSLTNNISLSGARDRQADYMNLYYAYVNMPWDNPYDSNGSIRSFKNAGNIWSKDKINPLQAAENSEFSSKSFSVDYDASLNINLTSWLSFASTNRLSAYSTMSKTFYAKKADNLSYTGTGYVSNYTYLSYGGISTNLLKFRFENQTQSLSGLIGFEGAQTKNDFVSGAGTGIPEGLNSLSVASKEFVVRGAPGETAMISYISQLNYSLLGKYFLTGSYRVDKSSAFPKAHRTASFPSLSAAWLLKEENIFKGQTWLSNLKLKASWGLTGMKDIGPSQYIEQFRFATQYDGQTAAVPAQMANPDLKWEQTSQLNGGIEIGFYDRVDISLDIYKNTTSNLLVYKDLAPSGGFKKQWQNVGEAVNTGTDLSISTTNFKTHDFRWTTDFTFSFNKNELNGFTDTILNTNSYGISQIYRTGGSLYTFYAKEYAGIDKDNGSMLWKDKSGNITHEYSDARYIEYGSPLPKYQGGFATELTYKNWSLKGNVSYVWKNKIYNYFRRYVDNDLQDVRFNSMKPVDGWKLWQQPGDDADHPLPQNASNSFDPSTRYIEDGSFLKIRNITLTYDLPMALVNKMKLHGITLSVSADNIYTFTKFSGQDPEVSINPNSGFLPGYAEFRYPNNKQFLVSLNVRF